MAALEALPSPSKQGERVPRLVPAIPPQCLEHGYRQRRSASVGRVSIGSWKRLRCSGWSWRLYEAAGPLAPATQRIGTDEGKLIGAPSQGRPSAVANRGCSAD